jgi:glycosyltransferase involved in cell wall biosynthesis
LSNQPNILAILPGFVTSTLMNVVNPMLHLQAKGIINFISIYEPYVRKADYTKADLVIYCRNTEPGYKTILNDLIQNNIPYVYDLDDDLFEIPLSYGLGQYHRAPQRLAMLVEYLENANCVRLYSKPLLERVLPLNPNAVLVSPSINWPLVNSVRPKLHPNQIYLVYATSRQEDPLTEVFIPALELILKKHREKVLMTFWGNCPPIFRNWSNVRRIKFTADYNRFLRDFSREGFDIGLAPLLNDSFYLSKTNNKFREYAACGIAGIYSDVPVYSEVNPNTTGLLVANDTQSWFDALESLIVNPEVRSRIGSDAKQYIQQKYPLESFYSTWEEQINNAPYSPRSAPRANNTIHSPYNPGKVNIISRLRNKSISKILLTLINQVKNIWWMLKINMFKKI